jgi:sugar phosphate isomerase/epimerase
MKRREFLAGAAAAAAPFVFPRTGRSQAANQQATLARLAIMSLTFGSILKNANQPDSPSRTLDIMDLGQMFADRYGVHNVELQHAYLPSTEERWLKEFRARLQKSRSRVSNINCEFGATMTCSADSAVGRLQAVDLTKRWVDHAVTLGCPRLMLNQGQLTEANRAVAVATLGAMAGYAKTKGVMLSLEPRGGGGGRRGAAPGAADAPAPPPGPPAPPAYLLLTEVIKAAGIYANVDVANYGDQDVQHAGIRAMMPYTVGNTHFRLNPARYDLAAAVRIVRDEFAYRGIYLIEAGVPAGPDPYASIQEIRDFMLEHV